jgi:hypothetical protein
VGGLRRWMRRIERDAKEESIAIELKDGSTQLFPKSESLILEFIVGEWEAGLAEGEGEEYVPDPEIERGFTKP